MDPVEKIRNEYHRLEEFDIEHLWVFGSSARGEADPGDIDVLVEFSTPPGLLNYMGLKFKLEEILGKPVDLVSKSACRDRFFKQIEKDLIDVA